MAELLIPTNNACSKGNKFITWPISNQVGSFMWIFLSYISSMVSTCHTSQNKSQYWKHPWSDLCNYVIIYLSIMFNHISLCKSKYTKNITMYLCMYIYFYDPCSDWVQDWPPLYIHKKDEREYEYSDGIINSKEMKINTQVILIVVN